MYRVGIVVGCFWSASAPSDAAPWTQDAGGAYLRSSVAYESLQTEDLWRGDMYAEYGIKDRWTVTAKAEATKFSNLMGQDKEAYRATLRHRLYQNKGWLFALEGGAVHGNTSAGIFGCDDWGGELRVSGGAQGKLRGKDFYLFLDAAQLRYEDGCRRNRIELGVGTHAGGRYHLSQQFWYETGNLSATSFKVQSQLIYRTDNETDFSIGLREELGGEFDERSVLIAVTLRH